MPAVTIKCGKCNRPVSSVTITPRANLDDFLFIVSCHGHLERTVMPARLFREGWYITEAVAFKEDPVEEKPMTEHKTEQLPLCLTYDGDHLETNGKTHKLDHGGPEQWAPVLRDAL